MQARKDWEQSCLRHRGGVEKVIVYYSRAMSRPEQNYCVTRKELLAMLSAVSHFHPYLYGRKFLVRIDHSLPVPGLGRREVSFGAPADVLKVKFPVVICPVLTVLIFSPTCSGFSLSFRVGG